MNSKTPLTALAVSALTLLGSLTMASSRLLADSSRSVLPERSITASEPVVRDLMTLPDATDAASVATKPTPIRPTMDPAAYNAAKARASAESLAGLHKPLIYAGSSRFTPDTSTIKQTFKGLDETASKDLSKTHWPPDCNGAIGTTQYAEITQSAYAVYNTGGTLLKKTPLSSFFNYTAAPITEPIVKYDRIWNRFVVTALAAPESGSGQQYLFIAASTGDKAKLSYFIYRIPLPFAGDTWEYSKMGMTQDAFLFDANDFTGSTFNHAYLFTVAKEAILNGRGFSSQLIPLKGTLTLPMVADGDGNAYMIYNLPGTSNVGVYTLTDAANQNTENITGPVLVDIGFTYEIPRNAFQTVTSDELDTSDTRFGDNTYQVGGVVYATNCIDLGGFPGNELLRIDGADGVLDSTSGFQTFFVSDTSDDFNPSVAVNDVGSVAVQWSETDWSVGKDAGIYIAGGVSGAGLSGFTQIIRSSTFLTGNPESSGSTFENWGGSSLSIDPTGGLKFWGTNEYIESNADWTTRNFAYTIGP